MTAIEEAVRSPFRAAYLLGMIALSAKRVNHPWRGPPTRSGITLRQSSEKRRPASYSSCVIRLRSGKHAEFFERPVHQRWPATIGSRIGGAGVRHTTALHAPVLQPTQRALRGE